MTNARPDRAFASIRESVEARYADWGGFVTSRPKLVVLASLLFFGLLTPQARHLQIDTHPEEFLVAGHPDRVTYTAFKERFGSDNFILVTLETGDIFDPDFLAWLRDLHRAIEERTPHVFEVRSLINARSTRGAGDELVVAELMDVWPETVADFRRLEALVRSTPFYERTLIGDGGLHTALTIEMNVYADSPEDGAPLDLSGFDEAEGTGGSEATERHPLRGLHELETVAALDSVLEDFARPGVDIYTSGLPILNVTLARDMASDFVLFMGLSLVAMIVLLSLLFRRAAGIVLPLAVVLMALAGTFGYVGLRGEPVSLNAQILPSFLLAVGSSAAIHLLVLFFQSYDRGASAEQAACDALGHSGLAVTLACLTTAAGMASFLVTRVGTVRDLGVMAPVGILLVLACCLTLLPALLVLVPMRRVAVRENVRPGVLVRSMLAVGDRSARAPVSTLVGVGLIVFAASFGIPRVEFEHDPRHWFAADHPLQRSMEISDEVMSGSTAIEIVIDTGRENGLYEPSFYAALTGLEERIAALAPGPDNVRKTVSVKDVVSEIHQALHNNDAAFYSVPGDRRSIAQELLLFENSGADDLEDLVDSQFRVARLSVLLQWRGAQVYEPFARAIERAAHEAFPDDDVKVTGLLAMSMVSMVETQNGMIESYALALITIVPIMMLLLGGVRVGLASMLPNLAPILFVVGAMGWLGVKVDSLTMMTGSIAIGLAVDDTIHFMHNANRELARCRDGRLAVRRTLETTGQALLATSLVLAAGFGVFMLSKMPSIATFGLFTTSAIVFAFMADILLSPAIVALRARRTSATDREPRS